jgi:hypothetical protein
VTRRTLPLVLVLGLCAGWLAAPASAREPNVYEQMVMELVETQRIDPCHYTTEQLTKAKAAIPADIAQYNAALIAAFDDAIAARAQGACNKKSGQTSAGTTAAPPPPSSGGQTPPPPQTSGAGGQPATQPPAAPGQPLPAQAPPTPRAEPTPAAAIAAGDAIALASHTTQIAPDAPFPMLALAILLGVLALCTIAFGVARWFAWEPAWAGRLRHATGEAGWRASSTWSDFTDYVRLGR